MVRRIQDDHLYLKVSKVYELGVGEGEDGSRTGKACRVLG